MQKVISVVVSKIGEHEWPTINEALKDGYTVLNVFSNSMNDAIMQTFVLEKNMHVQRDAEHAESIIFSSKVSAPDQLRIDPSLIEEIRLCVSMTQNRD